MTATPELLLDSMRLVHSASDGEVRLGDIGLDDEKEEEEEDLLHAASLLLKDGQITLWFAGEYDETSLRIDDFIRLSAECNSIRPGIKTTLTTNNFAYQVVFAANEMAQAVEYHQKPLRVVRSDGIAIQLQFMPLIVGVYASGNGFFGDHAGAASAHPSIELDFTRFNGERTPQLEDDLVMSYLFELASSHDIIFTKGALNDCSDEDPDWTVDEPNFSLRPLEASNEGVRLFLAAAQVDDPELRFFSFYKVLEHFAPIVLNLETHDILRKKLDDPKALAPDAGFLRDVLAIGKSFDQKRNDRDLIKGVLLSAVDLPGLVRLLPQSLRVNLTYESSPKETEGIAKDLAECLTATRNQVAHAKAAYEARSTECAVEDLPQLNEFLRTAAAQAVRWFNRLPLHLKVEAISKP